MEKEEIEHEQIHILHRHLMFCSLLVLVEPRAVTSCKIHHKSFSLTDYKKRVPVLAVTNNNHPRRSPVTIQEIILNRTMPHKYYIQREN